MLQKKVSKINFCNFIKPFMANKGMVASNDITLIEGKNVIKNEYEISQTLNKHYINIVEKSGGNKPNKIGTMLQGRRERRREVGGEGGGGVER